MTTAFRKLWFTLLLAVTLVIASIHFASHSVRADALDSDLVAYLAMGGSADDLCLIGEGAHDHSNCPFCRELDVFALADQSMQPALVGAVSIVAHVPSEMRLARDAHKVRPPARAPPFA